MTLFVVTRGLTDDIGVASHAVIDDIDGVVVFAKCDVIDDICCCRNVIDDIVCCKV